MSDDTKAPVTDEAAPKQQIQDDLYVSMDTPVDVEITKPGDPPVVTKITTPRNMWAMVRKILEAAGPGELEGYEIKITTTGKDKSDNPVNVVMASGPAKKVLDSIARQMIPSSAAAQIMFQGMKDLLECSPVRGVLVTAVFENQKPIAFAMLNHTLGDQLKPEDINMLAYHGQVNLDMFRDKMRKTGHQFPDDNPIIMPNRNLIVPR